MAIETAEVHAGVGAKMRFTVEVVVAEYGIKDIVVERDRRRLILY